MKTLNFKSAVFFALTALSTMTLSAQSADANSDANYDNGFRLGFGVTPGYVLREPYGFSLGGDVRLQYDFSKRYSVTLTSGYTHLFAKDVDVVGFEAHDLGFIPVKAGFKAFWWEDQFYAMGEAGAGFAVTSEINKTTAILSPSIGWANDYLDISVRYDYFSDFPGISNNEFKDGNHQIALRFAYGFRL
ncbi:MAG: hypothetical protein EOO50_07005 [Flavobacterium sp.]|uniref:hypothetical protein n=1 Tax=Flavobacterium sp. TaxID=239 RepID=UPI00120DD587|nr:hypothetical protein [Flavobacterium sp.]RZJ67004.1 MAG: hypothetical protein EOO50_07005 [Flavobacterium sp.]